MWQVCVSGEYLKSSGTGASRVPFSTALVIPECDEDLILFNLVNRYLFKHLQIETNGDVSNLYETEITAYNKIDGESGLKGKDIFKLTKKELEDFGCEYNVMDVCGYSGSIKENRAKAAWYYLTKTGQINSTSFPLREYINDLDKYEQESIIIDDTGKDVDESEKVEVKKSLKDVIKPKPKKKGRKPKKESTEFEKI